jgi:hypothetical protein
MDDDRRKLLARAVRAEEDIQLCRERLAAAYREIAEVRPLVPAKVRQVDVTAPADPTDASDPLLRLFTALAPRRDR